MEVIMAEEGICQIYPVLIGLMGCGKSSIGKLLAAELGITFLDLDHYIVEKAGRTIPEIFAEVGEEGFRDLETKALREVLGTPVVLASGGGVVMRAENRAMLAAHAPVIWLKSSLHFLAGRIQGDENRPLTAGRDALTVLQQLAEIRYPYYTQCADYILHRGEMNKAQSLHAVIEYLRQWKFEHSEGFANAPRHDAAALLAQDDTTILDE
ncbi:shikimate kinase [Mariprofundus ferrinatatus]|uniref:Shikimate kinase n=1 Tax=Mariprofundus ferrinatatus TaxID=1921087 RepID=A0A2K8L6P5_9PROT|nr:shikimate kinase [Mariprofundus ferrinatatus]ATX82988.1 shikimate kinase [Mariprofundus ferrinatatus]